MACLTKYNTIIGFVQVFLYISRLSSDYQHAMSLREILAGILNDSISLSKGE